MRQDGIWKWLTEDISSTMLQPVVEIVGRNRVLIENHNGIVRYEEHCIGVKMNYGVLRVQGRKLELKEISTQQLVIIGIIHTISLCGGENEESV